MKPRKFKLPGKKNSGIPQKATPLPLKPVLPFLIQKPSDLVKRQLEGTMTEGTNHKPKIINFLNLADFSIYTDSRVQIDEPLFEPIPPIIQFTDFEPLQIKEKIFKLRNKDAFVRRVKIIQPDSRLFQVIPVGSTPGQEGGPAFFGGNKVASGMEITYLVRFSPEAKIDYNYDLVVVTEREKFVVPIIAVGKRAIIDFPDLLDFSTCPVKYITEKPVVIRNLGDKTTKWSLKFPNGFDSDKKEGVLENGKNEQIIVKFYPSEEKSYKSEIILSYDGLEAYIPIVGSAQNGKVYLSKSCIQMDDAYIGLQSQQTLQIINKSNVKVDFQWRSFKTEKEEIDKKNNLKWQLEQEEAEERMLLKEIVSNEIAPDDYDLEDQDDSEEEEKDEKALMMKKQKKAELLLARKYKNIRKAIDDDLLLFQDDIFQIEPSTGNIWPNSEMTITVTFSPRKAVHYSCTAFCNISCSDSRLALSLAGEGIGPKAFLSTSEVNIGDIFVTEQHKTDIVIENHGEIEARFKLIPNETPFGKMFDFDILDGVLGVGERMPFTILFCSTILGEFSELFKWRLEGSLDSLKILFTGHVMAPSFVFDHDIIDFDKVSYSFPNTRKVRLTNTSTVPFRFNLRIPGDGKLNQKEFEIKPARDTIAPKSFTDIAITFISMMPKKYDMVMVVDIEGVGQDLLSIPIRAISEVPTVKVEPAEKLDFGKIFLRNPDTSIITLINDSALFAKYQVLPQSEESKVLADVKVEPESGQIDRHGRVVLTVTLITKKLGEISLPISINIVGAGSAPHTLNIEAVSQGPQVDVEAKELNFGNVDVLKEYSQKITIINKSRIEADFYAFTKLKNTFFKPIQKHGILKPQESLEVEVVCTADDSVKFDDTLHFVIKEGVDVDVQLKARGVGSTIFCKDDLSLIAFGTQYTHRAITKGIFIENKGRRTQKIQWQRKKESKKKAVEKTSKDPPNPQESEADLNVFNIFPDTISIPSKHGLMFEIKGNAPKKGKITEEFELMITVGNERKSNRLLTSRIEGDFVLPNLLFSEAKLFFKYVWIKGMAMMHLSKSIDITCTSHLPTNFTLKLAPPFSISQEAFSLLPGKSASLRVDFDPGQKIDRVSGKVAGKLQVTHLDHPHKETIDLIGELCFPNLTIDSTFVNFGAILLETSKKTFISMKNVSEMPVNYAWTFLEDSLADSPSKTKKIYPINEIFDILPLAGTLEVGEEEKVEFTFNSVASQRFKATAVCKVDGGPEYEVSLQGDSSLVSYKISSNLIELGEVRFCDWAFREFYVENTGKVNFDYHVSLDDIIRKGLVEVSPMSNRISGGEKQKLTIKICPGMPDGIEEKFSIRIGYFEPETIKIIGNAISPSILFNLPREPLPLFNTHFETMMSALSEEDKLSAIEALTTRETEGPSHLLMKLEGECDRLALCKEIQGNFGSESNHKYYERVILSTYNCEFGNVVLNSTKTKKIRIFNCSKLPVDLTFDSRNFKNAGFLINPERILRLPSSDSANVTITYTAKKNSKFGKITTVVPVEIKSGPKFQLNLNANITLPEISLDSEFIDFGRVIIGQRKRFFVKFVNEKEVMCEWLTSTRQDLIGVDKASEARFALIPSSGVIPPGSQQIVEFIFTPTGERPYAHKFNLVIKENPKTLVIAVRGAGASVNLEFVPEIVSIGPVLPYDDFAFGFLRITNNSDYDTELVSLEFDSLYLQEEEELRTYDELTKSDPLFVPVRGAGQAFWEFIRRSNKLNSKIQELEMRLRDAIEGEERESLIQELSRIQSLNSPPTFPVPVEDQLRHHILVFGPKGVGKTTLAKALAEEQGRTRVALSELVLWNIEKGSGAGKAASAFLQSRQDEFTRLTNEKEVLLKKAGKKADKLLETMPPLIETEFQFMTSELLRDLLRERLASQECLAGVVFDELESVYWKSPLTIVRAVLEVLQRETIQLILLSYQKDENGLQLDPIIEFPGLESLLAEPSQTRVKTPGKEGRDEYKSQKSMTSVVLPHGGKAKGKKRNSSFGYLEAKELDVPELFPTFSPLSLSQEEETAYMELHNEFKSIWQGQLQELMKSKLLPPNLPSTMVVEEKKEKPKPKKKGEEEEEVIPPPDPLLSFLSALESGNRILTELPIQFSLPYLIQVVKSFVPMPIYPDPSTLPVAEPIVEHILNKPAIRVKSEGSPHYSILTPEQPLQIYEKFPESLTPDIGRWLIPSKSTLTLITKFYSKVVGAFESTFHFEAFFSHKGYKVPLTGRAEFPSLSSHPRNLFWNVKKSRAVGKITKAWLQAEGIFEFGALLMGKSISKKEEPFVKNVNSTTIRIANISKFDTDVTFHLASSAIGSPFTKDIFFLDEEKMRIPAGEVPGELRIFAIPKDAKVYRDDLIISIKDNPTPVVIPLTCIGCKPDIEIKEGESIVFERLLLLQSDKKILRFRNRGSIPVKWKLNGVEALSTEFSVSIIQGELKPNEEIVVEFSFVAKAQAKFSSTITLVMEDVEGVGIFQEPKIIPVVAEAFDISVDLKFPAEGQEQKILLFGNLRVGEVKDQTFSLKNNGLYTVKLKMNCRKKAFRDCFTVEPTEFELDANQEKSVVVRFCSKTEIKLETTSTTTDMILEILEGKTMELFKPVPINVSANAVFSKYSISPPKSINFGPLAFNETRTRTFEIRNEGIFDFSYTIFDYFDDGARKELQEASERLLEELARGSAPPTGRKDAKDTKKDTKAPPKKDVKKGEVAGLKVGQWTINPNIGVIPPSTSVTIDVLFTGLGQRQYEQKLGIHIMSRDPTDQPQGVIYEVVAESCIPGIECEKYENIFEEQIVVPSVSSGQGITSHLNSNVFAAEEKAFFFGTLVPSKLQEDGIVEKFKILNRNKIPCSVKFEVVKKPGTSTEQFAFEIAPKNAKIPPHEHVYVKVAFKPSIMASYTGLFEAIVENGETNPKTHRLVFDLRGEGVLPTLKIERPRTFADERTLVLKFPPVKIGKSSSLPVVIKNDGFVPATAKFDLTPSGFFNFLEAATHTLTPKTFHSFPIEFTPKDIGTFSWTLNITTLLNPYESFNVAVTGEGFFENVSIEGIPEGGDFLEFGDVCIGREKRIPIRLVNNSKLVFRFAWSNTEDFSFSPGIGLIGPSSFKNIIVTLTSSKKTSYSKLKCNCEVRGVELESQFKDWDEGMSSLVYLTQAEINYNEECREIEARFKEEAKKGGAKKKGGKKEEGPVFPPPPVLDPSIPANIPYEEAIPEPASRPIEKSEKILELKVSGITDYTSYEVETSEIYFKPTLMYSTCSYVFRLRNTSLIHLPYSTRIVDSLNEVNHGFFSISPKSGEVPPMADELFTIRFTPTEVENELGRSVIFTIGNLDPNRSPLILELDGDVERPIVHFELPHSNYREKKPELEAKYTAVEIESLGAKVKNIRKFHVLNPTAQGYEFEWKHVEEDKLPNGSNPAHSTFFKCLTPKGIILSGKKFEMAFEYNPETVETVEAYWRFEIPSETLVKHFVTVGTVNDPKVFINVGKVYFGPLLLGGKNKETVFLRNLEEIAMPFSFSKDSIVGDPEYANSLSIVPMSGVIASNGEVPVEIRFAPKVEKEYNYNLQCSVKRREKPISLNVKGIGYILHHSVLLEDMKGALIPSEKYRMNYADLFVNEVRTKTITIENQGNFNFDYYIKRTSSMPFLSIEPESGTVKSKDKLVIAIIYSPTSEHSFVGGKAKLALSIVSGPTYSIELSGMARKPAVELSFYSFDFGPCFVLRQPLTVSTVLEMRNFDRTAMSVESSFEKTSYLDFQLASGQVMLPLIRTADKKEKNVLRVPIHFTPRENTKYDEIIQLEINALHKLQLRIQGEGVPLKLELEHSNDSNLDFGIVKVGADITKTVVLINNSRKQANISFDVPSQLADLSKVALSIFPQTLSLAPRERKEIEIRFAPKSRIHHLKIDLSYTILENKEIKKLLMLNAACYGVEVKLMEDTIGFGAVVLNSKFTRRLQMTNLGDIGASFEWDVAFCKELFTINPAKGYIPPHEDLYLEITFHPNVIENEIRFNKIKCSIVDSDPLFLTLLGKSIPQPKESITELKFEVAVRNSMVSKVSVKNPTGSKWRVHAVLSANLDKHKEYFVGKEILEILPNTSADYEIIYRPLTLTHTNEATVGFEESHEGTLFFALPDGSALLYNLTGRSLPPAAKESHEVGLKAKKASVHILKIHNWLKTTQRFLVSWVLINPDPSLFINGADTIDIPSGAIKEYKLGLFSLKEGKTNVVVTFKNGETGEYVFYNLAVTTTVGVPQNTTELISIVRETTSRLITIENPLANPIGIRKEFFSIDNDNLYVTPDNFTIAPHSEFGFEIVFRPLLAVETKTQVVLKSPELGDYVFPVHCVGLPSTSQRILTFKSHLGSDLVQAFKFTNYVKTKPTIYVCKVEKLGQPKGGTDAKGKPIPLDFTIETPNITAQPTDSSEGTELGVNVKFEPSMLTDSRALLTVSSPEGGEYQALLIGQTTYPQPKGPFTITGAKPPPIEFKNPFFEAIEFTIRIDNPAFTSSVKSPLKIEGKKAITINLVFKPIPNGSPNGKLTISAEEMPAWVFYLKGE